MLERSLWLYPTPRGIHCQCSTSKCSNSGNVVAVKGYDHVPASLEYVRGGQSEMDWDLEGQLRGMT